MKLAAVFNISAENEIQARVQLESMLRAKGVVERPTLTGDGWSCGYQGIIRVDE